MLQKVLRFCLLVALLWLPAVGAAQEEWTPAKSNRLVNDYSGMLSDAEARQLENRLVAFADSTSNQIVVVITPTLHGDEIKAVGWRIGQQWGVGQQEFNNGLVIIIKSKSREEPDGEVAILTGYGLEGALPDVFCRRIIDDQMIPSLSEGDYYRALSDALDIILPVAAGEYSYAQYRKDERTRILVGTGAALLGIGLLLFFLTRYAKRHPERFNNRTTYGGGSPWIGGSSYGGRSSYGGFGGFGGGGFGGGGASGRF